MAYVIGNKDGLTRWMRRLARGMGTIVAAFFLLIGIGSAFGDSIPWSMESTVITVLFTTLVVGVIIAWWREGIGGLIVTLGAITLGAFAYCTADHNKVYAMVVMGGPLLVSGILFLICWRRTS